MDRFGRTGTRENNMQSEQDGRDGADKIVIYLFPPSFCSVGSVGSVGTCQESNLCQVMRHCMHGLFMPTLSSIMYRIAKEDRQDGRKNEESGRTILDAAAEKLVSFFLQNVS